MHQQVARDPVFWQVGAFSNLVLLAIVTGSVLAQIAIHHLPFTESLFQISGLSLADCMLTLIIGLLPVTIIETTKLIRSARGAATSRRRADRDPRRSTLLVRDRRSKR